MRSSNWFSSRAVDLQSSLDVADVMLSLCCFGMALRCLSVYRLKRRLIFLRDCELAPLALITPTDGWRSGTTASICPTAPSTSVRRRTRLRLSRTSALVRSWPTLPSSRSNSTCPARPSLRAVAAKRTTCSRLDRSNDHTARRVTQCEGFTPGEENSTGGPENNRGNEFTAAGHPAATAKSLPTTESPRDQIIVDGANARRGFCGNPDCLPLGVRFSHAPQVHDAAIHGDVQQ